MHLKNLPQKPVPKTIRFFSPKKFYSQSHHHSSGLKPNSNYEYRADDAIQEKLISLAKRRGFVYPNSEFYGGLSGSFDYGALGTQLKKNLRELWWTQFISSRPECVGVETPIIMRSEVWQASGHAHNFQDPMVECKTCHHRFRADILSKFFHKANPHEIVHFPCPSHLKCNGNNLTEIKEFNLLFRTHFGPTAHEGDPSSLIYLRPETAQGIFLLFPKVLSHKHRLPLGIGQAGKSFRNEISPRDFLFRMREFEQLEMEYFVDPNEADKWYDYWINECVSFCERIGINRDYLRLQHIEKSELAHYSKATCDIQFLFPNGWGELWGIANRGDYDLKVHAQHTNKDMKYRSPDDPAIVFYPYTIEPSLGLDRLFYAVLASAYHEEFVPDKEEGNVRVVLKLKEEVAPFQYAVLPISKKDELIPISEEIFKSCKPFAAIDYDLSGSIGKRYRRQDEIGTKNCITVDFQSLEDKCVTVRDRDTMKQIRLPISQVIEHMSQRKQFFK